MSFFFRRFVVISISCWARYSFFFEWKIPRDCFCNTIFFLFICTYSLDVQCTFYMTSPLYLFVFVRFSLVRLMHWITASMAKARNRFNNFFCLKLVDVQILEIQTNLNAIEWEWTFNTIFTNTCRSKLKWKMYKNMNWNEVFNVKSILSKYSIFNN